MLVTDLNTTGNRCGFRWIKPPGECREGEGTRLIFISYMCTDVFAGDQTVSHNGPQGTRRGRDWMNLDWHHAYHSVSQWPMHGECNMGVSASVL